MKKIPTVFVRDEQQRNLVTRVVTPGCEWVLRGEGVATWKWNGTACLVREGQLYARFDAHRDPPPVGFLPAAERDEAGGHWLGWVPVLEHSKYKYHRAAFESYRTAFEKYGTFPGGLQDGTYELCGPKVPPARGDIVNPHGFADHRLLPHGDLRIAELNEGPRSYEQLRDFFAAQTTYLEGVVFWRDEGPGAKIKASDFGLRTPREIA
jgi:hypothetical protein